MRLRILAVAAVVTGVSTYVAFRNIDFAEVWETLRSSNYWWLLPALATLALAMVVRAVRWRYLFVRETRPGLRSLGEALLVGQFFNTVLPARAGDLARVAAINVRSGTSRAEALATVVVERVFDVLALLLLLFVTLPWLPDVSWVRTAAVLAIAVASALGAFVLVFVLYGERPLRFLLRPLGRLSFLSERRVELAAVNLAQGLAGLRRAHLGAASFALTVASWILLAVSFWLVTFCFDLELSLGAGLLVLVATGLSLILPQAPAGLGVFEAATVVALAAFDVSKTEALSYALVLHTLNVVPFLVAGLAILNAHGVRAGLRLRSVAGGPGVHEDEVARPAHRHPDAREL